MSEVLCEDCAKFCACDEVASLRADNERLRAALRQIDDIIVCKKGGALIRIQVVARGALAGEQEKMG